MNRAIGLILAVVLFDACLVVLVRFARGGVQRFLGSTSTLNSMPVHSACLLSKLMAQFTWDVLFLLLVNFLLS